LSSLISVVAPVEDIIGGRQWHCVTNGEWTVPHRGQIHPVSGVIFQWYSCSFSWRHDRQINLVSPVVNSFPHL